MSDKYAFRVIDVSELEELVEFEKKNLEQNVHDEAIRMFLSWKAPWRKESLEHYLPKGWCFAIREKEVLVGYFLAQPLLFFRQMTQSLWIEHLSFNDPAVGDHLLELAFKTAREKHIQSVFLSVEDSQAKRLVPLLKSRGAHQVNDAFFEYQSTRIYKEEVK